MRQTARTCQRRRVTAAVAALAAACAMLVVPQARAQNYPSKPIKINVPIAPGTAPDLAARIIGDKLAASMGQVVIVDNHPGANGNIAGQQVATSPPDGYTLMLCIDSQLVINPHIYGKMPYDPVKDLIPVATVASNEFFLITNPSQPFKTFAEFIAYAKTANPPMNYASAGNGSQQHLTMEMLKSRAGISLSHVPYQSSGPATTAVLGGEVPVSFAGSLAGPQIKAGKLIGLAVAARNRLPAFPDVPTIAETYPGFNNSIWLGVCAPRGTPDAIVDKLRAEINKALALPDVRERFARTGALEPLITTPDEFAAMIKSDYDKYGAVVKSVGAKVD